MKSWLALFPDRTRTVDSLILLKVNSFEVFFKGFDYFLETPILRSTPIWLLLGFFVVFNKCWKWLTNITKTKEVLVRYHGSPRYASVILLFLLGYQVTVTPPHYLLCQGLYNV